jgi:hypothetical protein
MSYYCALDAETLECSPDGRKSFSPVLAVSGAEPGIALAHESQQTKTVELYFMNPLATGGGVFTRVASSTAV